MDNRILLIGRNKPSIFPLKKKRLRTKPNILTTVTSSGSKAPGEYANADANKQASNRRFNRFERETKYVSPDILNNLFP